MPNYINFIKRKRGGGRLFRSCLIVKGTRDRKKRKSHATRRRGEMLKMLTTAGVECCYLLKQWPVAVLGEQAPSLKAREE